MNNKNFARYEDDGTVIVHKWITDMHFDVQRCGERVQRW